MYNIMAMLLNKTFSFVCILLCFYSYACNLAKNAHGSIFLRRMDECAKKTQVSKSKHFGKYAIFLQAYVTPGKQK